MIHVKFENRATVETYTTAILELLKTDPEVQYISDAETGELIFLNLKIKEA